MRIGPSIYIDRALVMALDEKRKCPLKQILNLDPAV